VLDSWGGGIALQRGPGGPWPTQNFDWMSHSAFGPWFSGKLVKFAPPAVRLRLKCTKFVFHFGSAPDRAN